MVYGHDASAERLNRRRLLAPRRKWQQANFQLTGYHQAREHA